MVAERQGQVLIVPAIYWGSPGFQDITIMTFFCFPIAKLTWRRGLKCLSDALKLNIYIIINASSRVKVSFKLHRLKNQEGTSFPPKWYSRPERDDPLKLNA